VIKWTVGVITSPRQGISYLEQTLDSLRRAGWNEPIVFAEPGSSPSNSYTIIRRKQYGDWTNWATGLYELLLSEPDTDYFLMAEDDVIFCKDSKTYLEYAMPQLGDFGSLSLYTPSIRSRNNFRGFHNELQGHNTWSTVTVIMSRSKVISFFADVDTQRHRFEDIFELGEEYWCCPKTDPKNSIKDAVIGHWAEKNQFPIYYHTPSLAEHIGDLSTLTEQSSTIANGRKSLDFVGEDFNLSEWFKLPINVRSKPSVILL
jgi:hypothetical protein